MGNTQEIKILKEKSNDIEDLLLRLNGNQSENSSNQSRLASSIKTLKDRVHNLERGEAGQIIEELAAKTIQTAI